MNRTLAIACMTFRRLVQTRVLAVALVLAALVPGGYSALVIRMIAAPREGRAELVAATLPTLIYYVVSLFSMAASAIALIIGVTVLRRDIVDGTVYGVLSKPVARGEYVAGNALGAFAMLAVIWIAFGLVLVGLAALLGAPLRPVVCAAVGGQLLKTGIFLSVAMLASTRCNAWGAAALTVLVVYGASIVETAQAMAGGFGLSLPERAVDIVCLPFPHMKALEGLMSRILLPNPTTPSVVPGVIHFADYTLAMLALAYLSFRRLDLVQAAE